MPAPRKDPFSGVSRRDVGWILLVGWVVLVPALAGIYALGQWFEPGTGSNWTGGLVQGALVPPLVLAALTGWRRWIRRRHPTGD